MCMEAVCRCLRIVAAAAAARKKCAATSNFPLKIGGNVSNGGVIAPQGATSCAVRCMQMRRCLLQLLQCGSHSQAIIWDVKVQEAYSVARMFGLCGSNFQTKWTKKQGWKNPALVNQTDKKQGELPLALYGYYGDKVRP